jgi:hypothetical protein
MPANKDPLARDRQVQKVKNTRPNVPPLEAVDERALKVWKLRTEKRLTPIEISKRLGIALHTVHRDLNDKHGLIMAAMSEYGQIRRNENERELEDFKAQCASYIYDPNVVIRGEEIDKDGLPRVVELSKFEAMIKVAPFYLTAINIQNKMWGLYTVPEHVRHDDAPGTLNIKNVSIQMVKELQQIAKNENLSLPEACDARTTDKGAPAPDSRRVVTG